MDESEVFAGEKAGDDTGPLPRRQVVRAVLLVITMTSGITSAHHTWTSYVSTYAITRMGMDAGVAYWCSVAARCVALATLPLWGLLSDRVGRRPMTIAFAVLMIAPQIPLTGLIGSEGWTLLVASSVSVAVFGGTAPYLNQLFVEWGAARLSSLPIMLLCAFTGVACSLMRETRGIHLKDA
ncbi:MULTISPECIES: hypothetical protein [unclassified Streptomyces]